MHLGRSRRIPRSMELTDPPLPPEIWAATPCAAQALIVALQRLRWRSVAAKRALALREFALGVEALERFVRRERLRRVHECVFGVLALESEPVDPRL